MTIIKIKDLEIFANHGVLNEENVLGQKFIVSVDMNVATLSGDNIENTINYADVCAYAEKFMQENTFALIETAVSELSKNLMLKYKNLIEVQVEIKKPWAPIKMNVSYVSAKITRRWHTVYAAIGSNLGDRRSHLNLALDKLRESGFCKNIRASEFIETKPVGVVEQNDFLNGCVEFETVYEPFELLEFFHRIEDEDGRTREVHWGPRTIDLDIIYFDDMIINTETLTIPHKEMSKRAFVLKPLKEIAPHKKHPVTGKTTLEMLEGLA